MMIKAKCALCDVLITTENNTKEHVVPNALGGRKKVKGFICNQCNSQTGKDWDVELAEQLKPLCLLFSISRQNGKTPSQVFKTTGGESYLLNHDGTMSASSPTFSKTQTDTDVSINFTVKNKKELKSKLKELKKKYPKLDEEVLLSQVEFKSRYINEPFHFQFSIGGYGAGRSIVKSALAMVYASGIPTEKCEHAIGYLRGDDSKPCFGYYTEEDLVLNRPEGIPLHCVYVKGSPETGQILGYVELFGTFRIVLCLSSSYEGESFSSTYSVNPVSGEALQLNIKLEFSPKDIQDIYDYKKMIPEMTADAFNKVMPTALRASDERERERVIAKAVESSLKELGLEEGDEMTPELLDKFTGYNWKTMEPYVLHRLNLGRERRNDG